MTEFDTPDVDRVAGILRAAGLSAAAPAIRTNEPNPDLLVSGRYRFWAEIKTLGEPPEVRALGRAREYLAPRLRNMPCAVDLFVDENASEREYKLLHNLIKRALAGNRIPAFALLSEQYNSGIVHTYELEFQSGQQVFCVAHLNDARQIVAPWQLDSPAFGQTFEIQSANAIESIVLRQYNDEYLVGAHLYAHAGHSGLLQTTRAKGMWQSTNQTRLRRDVRKANRQFSAACKSEALPGVVFLVGNASPRAFLAALLGDFIVSFSSRGTEASKAFYGKNGLFRPQHHTHVSTAYLLSADGTYFIANPFARNPIENIVPDANVISIDGEGNVSIP